MKDKLFTFGFSEPLIKNKMKKPSVLIYLILVLCYASILESCKKADSNPTSTLIIKLKDAPSSYDEVNVEVIEIQIHSNDDGWITIPVADSIYNLLLLQGNNSTFLANAVVPSGTISQVRLLLGKHNTVSVGGSVYPLSLSSQDETGLKLNIHQNLVDGVTYDLLIDFDASQSVVDEGNGSYRLKPVLSATFM
jgi:hypothetical protein